VRCIDWEKKGRTWVPKGGPVAAPRLVFFAYSEDQVQETAFGRFREALANSPLVGSQLGSSHLAGAGVGLQFNLPGRVFSRLDVAKPLTDREPSNDRDPQYYFRFGMNF